MSRPPKPVMLSKSPTGLPSLAGRLFSKRIRRWAASGFGCTFPPVRKPSPRVRRLAGIAIGLGIAVATFVFVLPEVANYPAVWRAVRDLPWWGPLALVAAATLNLVTFAPPWMAALPRLGFRQAFVVTQASTASTYIAPGGAAPGIAVS